MSDVELIPAQLLKRKAVVHVRRSPQSQVMNKPLRLPPRPYSAFHSTFSHILGGTDHANPA
jgi:hypothetical protein